jgi:hypothetical protein
MQFRIWSPIYNTNYNLSLLLFSHLDKSIGNDKIQLKGFQNPVRLDRNRHGGGPYM